MASQRVDPGYGIERATISILLLWRHLLLIRRTCTILTLAMLMTFSVLATPLSGITTINFSDDLLDLGLSLSPLGSATIDGSSVNFPITGGDADPDTLLGEIEHDGSGVQLSDGTNTLQFLNLLVDTTTARIFAKTIANGVNEGTPSVLVIGDGLSLSLSLPSIGLASAVFGIDDAILAATVAGSADIQIGIGNEDGPVIPEPSTWLMMLSGLGMVVAGRKRFLRAS
jgi:hypothetical protein